jgi:hypothetical protein
MPPKKKKGNHSRPASSALSSTDVEATASSPTVCSALASSPTVCSALAETHISPPLSSPSDLAPSAVLRLLLASEASEHSLSGIARSYLQCVLTSSMPDDLRTPATIVLLGAECSSRRADRFCPPSLSPPSRHLLSFALTHVQVCETLERAAFYQGCFCYRY